MTAANTIQSILVATDRTDKSIAALYGAIDIATVTGASLHVVHAYEEPSVLAGGRDLLTVQRQVHDKRTDLVEMLLDTAGRRIEIASARVQIGTAAEVILREASYVKADIIILGAHQHRGLADRLLGATAEHVLRRATVPCLVVNGPLSLPIGRILVPTDLAPEASLVVATALGWADMLCQNGDAEVTLAHVADPAIDLDGAPSVRPELLQELETAAGEARQMAKWWPPIRTRLLRGDEPAQEIVSHASTIDAGLIVMATQADTVIVRTLLGSVTSSVVRMAEVPLLMLPPRRRLATSASARTDRPDLLTAAVAI